MKYTNLSQIQATGVSHNPSIRKQVMLENGDFVPCNPIESTKVIHCW
ncbi:MAG: hypothetical protein HC795_18075 [Coleofasciculaceae cyanobacterium RL_1_1]|nr:hypothetical protein [Coleofasciculaceae cyanobacterium RL_1_1]